MAAIARVFAVLGLILGAAAVLAGAFLWIGSGGAPTRAGMAAQEVLGLTGIAAGLSLVALSLIVGLLGEIADDLRGLRKIE